MSGHEDDDHALAQFNFANDGIDHSDYKQTDDYDQPLHFDSTNNFQDTNNSGTSSFRIIERQSQVKKTTSSSLNNQTNEKRQQNDILQQAWQHSEATSANEFIDALLDGSLFSNGQGTKSAFDNRDSTEALNHLIQSGQFTDMYGSTVDFDHNSKGSKFKNHDDEDNQDIHGGNTSNACDDDIHGINSPGSSQASQNSRFYDKPSSSTSPAAPSPAETIVIQPTSPPLQTGTPSKQKEFTELEVFHGSGSSVVHEDHEYTGIDYSTEIIPRTQYSSGISVGPVQPQVILPSPIAAPPLPQTTVLADPLHANNHYSVDKVQLSNFLKENGRQVSGRKRKSKEEIERLIKRFCDPKELDYCTESDAQDIIDSDFEVKNVPLRNRADHGKYLCKFCPITQKHKRGFERKEDMKRHYHQHLNYVRFSCKHCEYKNARTDHMKNHMKKCHPEKDSMDYNRNS